MLPSLVGLAASGPHQVQVSGISGELDLLGVGLVARVIHAAIAAHPAKAVAQSLDVRQVGPGGDEMGCGLLGAVAGDQLPQRARAWVLMEGAIDDNLPAAAASNIGANFQLQFGHGVSRLAVA